jgi:cob(I)alamin adenosyltransferase
VSDGWPKAVIMKLYTRSGDDGTTGLFSGARVSKNHPRIEAYGTVDEFNACLGLCISACGSGKMEQVIRNIMVQIQSRLFDIGADLATPEGAKNESKIVRIDETHVTEVERWIDEIDSKNTPLQTFVMPGGTDLASRLHLARTVCRRAERLMVGLANTEPVGEGMMRYMNRVSDLLFAMARLSNKESGVGDIPWKPHGIA